MSRIDDSKEFIPIRIALLTVSDTRELTQDRSGDTLAERIESAGHHLADRRILRDERDQIAAQLRAWIANPEIDVVISTGGTGLTGRDVTIEAHRDVYEKEITAFGTVFTIVSMAKIGTSAVQSRATGAWRAAPISLPCPAAPAPAATPGTRSSSCNSIIATCRAISSRSCHALKNINAGNEPHPRSINGWLGFSPSGVKLSRVRLSDSSKGCAPCGFCVRA